MRNNFVCSLIIILFIITSCKKDNAGGGSKSSAYGGTESHNVGKACLGCHNTGGGNDFWWTVAGTVYKTGETDLNPNSAVYLFSGRQPDGKLLLTLQVDSKGNFYTTQNIDFSKGLFPAVKSISGDVRYMPDSAVSGNCNDCHVAGKRIVVL